MFILSCKVKDSIDEMQKLRTIEKTEDYGALSDFLKSLPKISKKTLKLLIMK